MKYIQELYVNRHCGGPIADTYTGVAGVPGRITDHNGLVSFEEIQEPYGPEEEVHYSSPSFGPSVTYAQKYICAYVMDAQDGAWFETEDRAQFLLMDGEWLVSENGGEFLPMKEPFTPFCGSVEKHFSAFGW